MDSMPHQTILHLKFESNWPRLPQVIFESWRHNILSSVHSIAHVSFSYISWEGNMWQIKWLGKLSICFNDWVANPPRELKDECNLAGFAAVVFDREKTIFSFINQIGFNCTHSHYHAGGHTIVEMFPIILITSNQPAIQLVVKCDGKIFLFFSSL